MKYSKNGDRLRHQFDCSVDIDFVFFISYSLETLHVFTPPVLRHHRVASIHVVNDHLRFLYDYQPLLIHKDFTID